MVTADGALNGDTYNNMLQENIITSIRRAYGVRFSNYCWFKQDGAPAHRRLTVRDTMRPLATVSSVLDSA